MRTLATAVAMATVLTVPAAAKALLKNPQRLLPDYIAAGDVKDIPRPSDHLPKPGACGVRQTDALRSAR
jgi:hypothetical protein